MSAKEVKDLTYTINVDEETGEKTYFLDDKPWEFVDPSQVKVGSMIWFDPNGLDRYGIVTNIRQGDFTYYDTYDFINSPTGVKIEEVAAFQVYRVENREAK